MSRVTVFVALLVLVVASFGWLLWYALDDYSDCQDAGGVMVRHACIDKDAVITDYR